MNIEDPSCKIAGFRIGGLDFRKAVICFEWLQRPENVLAGILRWPDYRSKEWPSAIKILHHKTGAVVWHPLEETVEATTTQFYAEAGDPGPTSTSRRPDDPA